MAGMTFYLIENLMGFERPVETGSLHELERKQRKYEGDPASGRVGPASTSFLVKARYYVVPKDDWDIHHCPLIPVDLD
ncbi:MAG: hypothetical protein ABII06_11505 [Pseudomonadota bacterium]